MSVKKTTSCDSGPASRGTLLRFLFSFAWKYRAGCIKVLVLQCCLLTMALVGLSYMGVGVDYICFKTAAYAQQTKAIASAGTSGQIENTHQPPSDAHANIPAQPRLKALRWPFGIHPDENMPPMRVLMYLAGAILALALLRGTINYFYSVEVNKLVQGQIVVDLRAQVYETMQRLSFRFFDANASGSIINRVLGDVQQVRLFVDGVVIPCVVLVLSLVVYLIYMLHIHIGLTIACLITTPLLWYATRQFSRRVHHRYRQVRDLTDNLVRVLNEHLQGINVVKGFGLDGYEVKKFAEANRKVRDEQLAIFKTVSWFNPLIGFISQLSMLVLIGYGGYLVICFFRAPNAHTGISVGQLLVFSGLLQQFSGQVGNIANIANSIQQSIIAAQRVHEVLTAPLEIQNGPNPIHVSVPRGAVAFENVTFGYSRDEPVLKNISMTVSPGECIAILGATGSGKSTLMSLIPRFYDPVSGVVRIDGVDAREMDLADLRGTIGIVFQENFLFSTSVAANIAFGRPHATREEVIQAAHIAAADEFIQNLPKGYDTILHEGGADLSGGQRQRIAIARAILRNPTILLLDDPTAAIDAHTEEAILRAMESAMKGRTTFVVAHRISTLRQANRVIVLDHGRIAETGTHDELMRREGLYQEVVALQISDQQDAPLTPPGGGAR